MTLPLILLITAGIIIYLVIGGIVASILIRQDIKNFGEADFSETAYTLIGLMWPFFVAFRIIASPYFVFDKILKCYAEKHTVPCPDETKVNS